VNWDALIAFARTRVSPNSEIIADLIGVGMSGNDSIALAYADQEPLKQAYLFAMNYCAALAGECVRRGFPPVPPTTAPHWEAARVERRLPADVFALHDHLRAAFYELVAIRAMLKRSPKAPAHR